MMLRPRDIKHFFIIPLTLGFIAFVGIFGFIAQANNDILVSGKLWEQGMPYWDTSIAVDPGQEFKVTLIVSHINPEGAAVSNISLSDDLPSFTSYAAGSAYQITEPGGSWQAMADDGTTPFDNGGVVSHGGTLAPFAFANYKYSVKVDNFLPTGTIEIPWGGPVFSFTDSSGAQIEGNSENTSIAVSNLPNIDSFDVGASSLKLGDTLLFTARGTQNKNAYVDLSGKIIPLSSSGVNYSGTYTVQSGDDMNGVVPRIIFENAPGTGAYLDSSTTVSIDTVPPAGPSAISSSVDSNTLRATVQWSASVPEGDVEQYLVYSNNGSGDIDYTTPIAAVPAGVTAYATQPLTPEALYQFVVRAQDASGNTDGNIESTSASTDFVPPDAPGSLVQPTSLNNTVLQFDANHPLSFVWTASPSSDVARYRIEIDDDSDFSSVVASKEVGASETTLVILASDLVLPDGAYYWRVSAIDGVGNISNPATGPDNTFEIDTTAPSVLVTAPLLGRHIGGGFTMTGTATDGSAHMSIGSSSTGIQSVGVLLTDVALALIWNGTAWGSEAFFIPASSSDGFQTWSYLFDAPIINGHTYVIGARATDQAGFIDDVDSLILLTGNTATPVAAIVSPVSGKSMGGPITITGTANDPGGSSITDVSVSIQRDSDSLYWNNSSWVADEAWVLASTADSFASWTYSFAPDLSAPDGVAYSITARATDGVFGTPNIGSSGVTAITKDTTAPEVSITSPIGTGSLYNAASWAATHPISGTASDAGSAIAGVVVEIQDSSGEHWNGSGWISSSLPPVFLPAVTSDGFATWRYSDGAGDFIPNKNGIFTIHAIATDAALGSANQKTDVATVYYDTIPPAIDSITITNATLNDTAFVKNGDVVILTATITDNLLQGQIATGDITADLSEITGNPADTARAASAYDNTTGTAVWGAVTAASTGDGTVTVMITAADAAGNGVSDSNTILADNSAPFVSSSALSSPSSSGVAWAGNSSQTIAWDQSAITDPNLVPQPITLAYSTDGNTWTVVASNEANDGSYDWPVPAIDSNTVRIRISARDLAGNTSSDVSDAQFVIDSAAPSVSSSALTAPNGDEAWKQGTVQQITWNTASLSDNFGLAALPISLAYSTDNGANWAAIPTDGINDGSQAWTIPADVDSEIVRVKITVADAAGNAAEDISDADFAIGIPPVVTEVRAVDFNRVEVVFSKNITDAGAAANYAATGMIVTAATVADSANTVALTVNNLNNTAFTASDFALVAGTVTDTGHFTNEAYSAVLILDRQLPYVTGSKLLSLPGADYAVITWSEDVTQASSEDLANYHIESPIASSLSLTNAIASYTQNKTIIRFDSSGVNLSRGDDYRYQISGVADVAGNVMTINASAVGPGGPFVEAGASITEIVADPRQDWSSSGFTGTPGGTPAADDRYIELYLNENGLDLSNWSFGLSDTGSGEGGNTFGSVSGSIVYFGTGSLTNTAVGDIVVIPISSLSANKRVRIYEEYEIVVDSVALGSFNDGNLSDNAPSGISTAFELYDESVSRDGNRIDTDNDLSDWHLQRATPGAIDATAPEADMTSVFPVNDSLIAARRPAIRIELIENGSGVRDNSAIDPAYANQVVLLLDGVEQAESFDPSQQVATHTPSVDLAPGKHTISVTLRDNAGNTSAIQSWNFWIDAFSVSISSVPIAYRFDGNTVDETDLAEKQQITVSTYGATYTVFARLSPDLNDGYGNAITDIDMKQASGTWSDKIDLSGSALAHLVQVASVGSLPEAIEQRTYTFDVRAAIAGITQPAGDYAGSIEFVVVPIY